MKPCEAPLLWAAVLCAVLAASGLDGGLPPAPSPARAGRKVKRFTSLTGLWTGAYTYALGASVPFNARLEEAGAAFSGDIDEPNTYADPGAPRLYARVSGARTGLDISFVKQMDGTGGAAHAIFYSGTADPDLSRIDGMWSLPGGFSGSFFMERAGVEAEAAVARAAGALG